LVIQMQGCSLAQAEGEWVVCRLFRTQRSSNRPEAASDACRCRPRCCRVAVVVVDRQLRQ
jgi:hypothetical protein